MLIVGDHDPAAIGLPVLGGLRQGRQRGCRDVDGIGRDGRVVHDGQSGFDDEQPAARVERGGERTCPGRRIRHGIARSPVGTDPERVDREPDRAPHFVGDHQQATIGAEDHVARHRDRRAQHLGGPGERAEEAIGGDGEAGDLVSGDRTVEHVKQLAVVGDAERLVAGIDLLEKRQLRPIDREDANIVAAWVHRIEEAMIGAEHQAALRIEIDADPVAARRIPADLGQPPPRHRGQRRRPRCCRPGW